MSVNVDPDQAPLLEASCVCYNSRYAAYYLFLTSGRFAFDRSEPLITELRDLPIPKPSTDRENIEELTKTTKLDQLDEVVYELLNLNEAEVALIEDLIKYTLADFKGEGDLPGYQPTRRLDGKGAGLDDEPDLRAYCEFILRVLQSAYGADKPVGAVIHSDKGSDRLPMRLVSLYLNSPSVTGVTANSISTPELRDTLLNMYRLAGKTYEGKDFYQRCFRTYDARDGQHSLMINIVKPDQARYWIRSMALRDADAIVSDITLWATGSESGRYSGRF